MLPSALAGASKLCRGGPGADVLSACVGRDFTLYTCNYGWSSNCVWNFRGVMFMLLSGSYPAPQVLAARVDAGKGSSNLVGTETGRFPVLGAAIVGWA